MTAAGDGVLHSLIPKVDYMLCRTGVNLSLIKGIVYEEQKNQTR